MAAPVDPPIIVAAAVHQEVRGLLDCLAGPVTTSVGGRPMVSGTLAGRPVRILASGPGLANSVQALTAAIECCRPSLIIQTGCAGAFRDSGLRPGDLGIATEEIDPALGLEPQEPGRPLEELPFPVLEKEGLEIRNRYPLDQGLADLA
jgi:futalosine hydrolase